jgi:hypothetical protein
MGVLAALVAAIQAAPNIAAEPKDPLSYVPSNAAVFAHARVADLWETPLVSAVRKDLVTGLAIQTAMIAAEKEIGIRPDIVDTATFFYPTMPQGPGDQTTFVVIITTTKPYDKAALLKNARKNDGKETNGFVPLDNKLQLHFADERTFVVLHESHIDKFKKGEFSAAKEGPMTEALKLAKAKHHFVLSLDFSMLPNEILTAAPAELQPFLPLLKSKSSVLFADLKDKELKAGLNFVCADGNAAQEAERSFKLLMKLASDGLADVLKDERALKEIGALLPVVKEIEKGVNNVKFTRNEARLETSTTMNADFPVEKMVAELLKKIDLGSSGGTSVNNLKQIALATINFADANKGSLPAAAICDKKGRPLLSWRVAILPYIEQGQLYKQFKLDEPWDSEHNKKLIEKMPKVYALPGAKAEGKTHYRVFTGNKAGFEVIQSNRFPVDFPDGTSNTCMVVESAEPVEWTKPEDIEYDPKMDPRKALRWVDDRTWVAIFDGSVRAINKKMSEQTWHFFIQRDDGNVLGDDF